MNYNRANLSKDRARLNELKEIIYIIDLIDCERDLMRQKTKEPGDDG